MGNGLKELNGLTLLTYKTDSGESAQESDKQPRPALELVDRDPFVRGVGLGNVSWPEDDAGNAAGREHARISEEIDPHRFSLAGTAEELPNEREARVGFEGGRRFAALVVEHRGGKTSSPDEPQDLMFDGGIAFARDGASNDFNDATIGHDVWLAPAGDGADVDRGVAEQRMAAPAQQQRVIGLEQVHDPGHEMDGIPTELGPLTMGGFALSFELQPQILFVRGDH